ncbi:MAG TPA: xanthine dehydrogenase family protein molybdopterin-binding subunit [Acidimicrobiales bacterium]|nr:xanthine dehydrogenase family protein molybdopterin-binding subunit [Acidimicrobiales bacterium]
MPGSILGNAVRRVEDPELLVGQSRYVDDIRIDGALRLAYVRSPLPHARIRSVDTSAATEMPGVVAVLVAADLGLAPHHPFFPTNPACARPPLASEKVRFVGDIVAVVAAETQQAAVDAAEAVAVDYDPLPAAVDPEEALAEGAPLQFEELGSNLSSSLKARVGSDALEGAEVVVRGRFVNQRVAVLPLEGNAIAVVPDPPGEDLDLTIYVSTQMPHAFARLVHEVLGVDRERVRVIAPHVGGGFGGKAGLAGDHSAAIATARRLGRPVKWVETRSENLVAMPHGRGQVQYVEMGLTRDGVITGMRCRVVGDGGAYAGFGGMLAMGSTRLMAQGVYHIPRIVFEVATALTNTTPMGAFRGAGRPEAAALLERIIDLAADDLGIDPVEIRRRNFIGPDEFPYKTLTGANYDSGDYDAALTKAVELSGYEDLRREQAARRERGERLQLGIGVGCYVEVTAGGMSSEYASVEVHPDGDATIKAGTSAHGQGHATSFAMIVSDRLGIPIERIRFVQSDTSLVPRGSGTGGSRSLQIAGSAVGQAADAVLEQARNVAAGLLEADPADITLGQDGRLGVAGVPSRALAWSDVARTAAADGHPLVSELDFEQAGASFPFGAHVSVVEVDTETGLVRPLRHVAVDDCGRIINPLLVTGQQHGGIAQGMAQALWEEMVFDADGNPRTATLADYAMPSAAEVPFFETANTETPSPMNPLGAKGIGESGTIGSTPAVQNAVVDALSHLGVRHVDMPCTPERVWTAIQEARAGRNDAWREPPDVFDRLPDRAPAGGPAAVRADI